MPSNRHTAPRRPHPAPQLKQRTKKPTLILLARGDDIRTIHLTPRTLLVAGGALLAFSVLYFGATAYLVFRDDIVGSSSSQNEQLLESYEDRIAALRTEIDRLNSRRAVDHATVSEKVDRLLDMQQTLDERQQMVARLAEAARRAGFDVPPPKPTAKPPTGSAGGPQASATPVSRPVAVLASAASIAGGAPPAALDQVESQIRDMESQQQQVIDALGAKVAGRADRLATILTRLGYKPAKSAADNVGGPFVPLTGNLDPEDRFDAELGSLASDLDRLGRIRAAAHRLPLARPVASAEITSGFGPRNDPFLGRPAMHTGVDFRAQRGAPARAVAAGTVVAAGWDGGYGNMVDVDLGNGIVTRYGHLSAIDVVVGDHVEPGAKVGRIGSTGRSTGPHLHYEIRINGQAVNPMRYLDAADEIARLI